MVRIRFGRGLDSRRYSSFVGIDESIWINPGMILAGGRPVPVPATLSTTDFTWTTLH